MRKYYLIALSLLAFTSCESTDIGTNGEMYNDEVNEYTIDLNTTDDLTFGCESATLNLTIGANYWREVSLEYVDPNEDGFELSDWMTIESDPEGYGNQTITATISRNINMFERQVKLVFTSTDDPLIQNDIILTQESAVPAIDPEYDYKLLGIIAYSFDIKVTAAGNWTATYPDWISMTYDVDSDTTGLDADTVDLLEKTTEVDNGNGTKSYSSISMRDISHTLTVTFNDTEATRNGYVVFTNDEDPNVTSTVWLEQSGVAFIPEPLIYNTDTHYLRFISDPTPASFDIYIFKKGEYTEGATTGYIHKETIINDPDVSIVTYDFTDYDFGDYVGSIELVVDAWLSATDKTTSDPIISHSHFGASSGDGSGSGDDAIKIDVLRHFQNIQSFQDLGDLTTYQEVLSYYYEQTADLDFSSVSSYYPISPYYNSSTAIWDQSLTFSGTYDGKNYSVKNLAFTNYASTVSASLFARVTGTIKNLKMVDCSMYLTQASYIDATTGLYYGTGGFVSLLDEGGLVENCHNENLTVKVTTGTIYIASIVGVNNFGTIRGCTATGGSVSDDTGYRTYAFGGIVSKNGIPLKAVDVDDKHSIVENCINYSFISEPLYHDTRGLKDAGGIAWTNNSIICNCDNYANIVGNRYVAGIAAWEESTYDTIAVTDCTNYGDITATFRLTTAGAGLLVCAGGIVGKWVGALNYFDTMTIARCRNVGNVTFAGAPSLTTLDYGIGGIAGVINRLVFEDNYNDGKVTSTITKGTTTTYIGGLVGFDDTQPLDIKSSYSSASLTVTGYEAGGVDAVITQLYAPSGALYGDGITEMTSDCSTSFYTNSGDVTTKTNATTLTAAEMKVESNFTNAGWDFSSVWTMGANAPELQEYVSYE